MSAESSVSPDEKTEREQVAASYNGERVYKNRASGAQGLIAGHYKAGSPMQAKPKKQMNLQEQPRLGQGKPGLRAVWGSRGRT